ncbi:hydroxymethylglutaryl-CoA reductase [Kiritimatiellaeota bacterium B1221]|nr:hydroxymethylglutaryl-CoA reductase [Kiritimatiellaeota bacterium B1221]
MNASKSTPDAASVPLQWVGPLSFTYQHQTEELEIPLATYESPLWPSTARGARVSCLSGSIQCTLIDQRMTRSILLEAPGAGEALSMVQKLKADLPGLQRTVSETSRFAKLLEIHPQYVGNLVYLRFAFETGDASGHNMTTKASARLLESILSQFPEMKEVSVSGNYCTDKKTSAVNGILGRGKYVVTEAVIPEKIVRRYLKSSAEKIVELNIRKNLIGTLLAGGLRSANAHAANILLAFYLATGQDAANIIEGSQAITHCENRDGDLYFSLTLPNLIVGSVGNGKGLPFVEQNLERLGCRTPRPSGQNAARLAAICAAATWCGELSLMAALTQPGELMRAHEKWERT